MKKKIPNFLANQRQVVSNFLDRNEGLIIGDTEKVLDIKNQYLIETYLFTIYRQIEKNKDLAYATVDADTGDGYNDFHYYPLIEIKKKGSGLNDILKKNNHPPSGFFCIHDYAPIHRRHFDFYNSFHKFTSKKHFVKSIKVSSGSICIFPLSNNLENNPFTGVFWSNSRYDLNLISLGKNKKKIIDKIKKFSNHSSLKFNTPILYKMNKNNLNKQNLVKSAKFEYPRSYGDFIDFTEDLKKSGALLEVIDTTVKPYEKYDKEKIKSFQKELNYLKNKKIKKKEWEI